MKLFFYLQSTYSILAISLVNSQSSSKCVGYPEAPSKSPSSDFIHVVNALGTESIGMNVSFEAVVVADLRANDRYLYIQTPSSHLFGIEDEINVSQALPVSANGDQFQTIEEGDYIRATGTISNFNSFIFLLAEDISILSSDKFTPALESSTCPAMTFKVNVLDVNLPLSVDDEFKPFAGMLTRVVNDQLTVVSNFDLTYGQLLLAPRRLFSPSMIFDVETEADELLALDAENTLSMLAIDDSVSSACPAEQLFFQPQRQPISRLARAGSTIDSSQFLDRTVILTFFERNRQIHLKPTLLGQQVIPDAFDVTLNPRSEVPISTSNSENDSIDLTIASLNMLNYFVTLNSRGADTESELELQEEKLVAAIKAMNAAVVGLMEIENAGDEVLQRLINKINENDDGSFDFISTGVVGTDAISNGVIFQPNLVQPMGDLKTLEFTNPERKSRPALAQTFVPVGSDVSEAFTIVVNHFKSKGSGCDEDQSSHEDSEFRVEGEGNCGYSRQKHARQLIDWIKSDPTDSNTSNYFLVGDFNAYRKERAVKEIENDADLSFVNLIDGISYSYIFRGLSGTLDYVFASDSLAEKCLEAAEWHINADEPPLSDYNEEYSFCSEPKPEEFNNNSPFRSSDHDPALVKCSFSKSNPTSSPPTSSASDDEEFNRPLDADFFLGMIAGVLSCLCFLCLLMICFRCFCSSSKSSGQQEFRNDEKLREKQDIVYI